MAENWSRASPQYMGTTVLILVLQNNNFPIFTRKFHDFGNILTGVGGGGGVTCRVKIDPLDHRKPYTKYIWGESPLQMEFNAPIRAVKTIIFNISQVEARNVPVTKISK